MKTASYSFTFFADYFQFYLQDENADSNLSGSWTEQAVSDLLAVAPGAISIGAARNKDVPVEVEIHNSEPGYDSSHWDHITECGIDIPSGKIVVAGCTDYFPDAARVAVSPGSYRARIYYGNLNLLSDDGLDGEDHYKVALWPSGDASVRVIKRRQSK
ncbi:MAG: hypothetical protein H7Z38_09300 [Rubrivivax sp.]|nr:hypothetical protein [Pyrinomonadaceae bacterium]